MNTCKISGRVHQGHSKFKTKIASLHRRAANMHATTAAQRRQVVESNVTKRNKNSRILLYEFELVDD